MFQVPFYEVKSIWPMSNRRFPNPMPYYFSSRETFSMHLRQMALAMPKRYHDRGIEYLYFGKIIVSPEFLKKRRP